MNLELVSRSVLFGVFARRCCRAWAQRDDWEENIHVFSKLSLTPSLSLPPSLAPSLPPSLPLSPSVHTPPLTSFLASVPSLPRSLPMPSSLCAGPLLRAGLGSALLTQAMTVFIH